MDEKPQSIITEIRAGAGGKEATLFADELFNMYLKYSQSQNWPIKIIEPGVMEIKSVEAYGKLKNEAGVHRVQRIPSTEKSGRIHTSTASVTILPIYPEKNTDIKPEDLEMGFTHSGGKGGQNVNKVETAVRITHKPTGLTVKSEGERSQQRNREEAMKILKAKIIQTYQEAKTNSVDELRKGQIGTQDRSEKIRTYNFMQDRVTDHRFKKSWHNLEKILNGDLGKIIGYIEKAKATT